MSMPSDSKADHRETCHTACTQLEVRAEHLEKLTSRLEQEKRDAMKENRKTRCEIAYLKQTLHALGELEDLKQETKSEPGLAEQNLDKRATEGGLMAQKQRNISEAKVSYLLEENYKCKLQIMQLQLVLDQERLVRIDLAEENETLLTRKNEVEKECRRMERSCVDIERDNEYLEQEVTRLKKELKIKETLKQESQTQTDFDVVCADFHHLQEISNLTNEVENLNAERELVIEEYESLYEKLKNLKLNYDFAKRSAADLEEQLEEYHVSSTSRHDLLEKRGDEINDCNQNIKSKGVDNVWKSSIDASQEFSLKYLASTDKNVTREMNRRRTNNQEIDEQFNLCHTATENWKIGQPGPRADAPLTVMESFDCAMSVEDECFSAKPQTDEGRPKPMSEKLIKFSYDGSEFRKTEGSTKEISSRHIDTWSKHGFTNGDHGMRMRRRTYALSRDTLRYANEDRGTCSLDLDGAIARFGGVDENRVQTLFHEFNKPQFELRAELRKQQANVRILREQLLRYKEIARQLQLKLDIASQSLSSSMDQDKSHDTVDELRVVQKLLEKKDFSSSDQEKVAGSVSLIFFPCESTSSSSRDQTSFGKQPVVASKQVDTSEDTFFNNTTCSTGDMTLGEKSMEFKSLEIALEFISNSEVFADTVGREEVEAISGSAATVNTSQEEYERNVASNAKMKLQSEIKGMDKSSRNVKYVNSVTKQELNHNGYHTADDKSNGFVPGTDSLLVEGLFSAGSYSGNVFLSSEVASGTSEATGAVTHVEESDKKAIRDAKIVVGQQNGTTEWKALDTQNKASQNDFMQRSVEEIADKLDKTLRTPAVAEKNDHMVKLTTALSATESAVSEQDAAIMLELIAITEASCNEVLKLRKVIEEYERRGKEQAIAHVLSDAVGISQQAGCTRRESFSILGRDVSSENAILPRSESILNLRSCTIKSYCDLRYSPLAIPAVDHPPDTREDGEDTSRTLLLLTKNFCDTTKEKIGLLGDSSAYSQSVTSMDMKSRDKISPLYDNFGGRSSYLLDDSLSQTCHAQVSVQTCPQTDVNDAHLTQLLESCRKQNARLRQELTLKNELLAKLSKRLSTTSRICLGSSDHASAMPGKGEPSITPVHQSESRSMDSPLQISDSCEALYTRRMEDVNSTHLEIQCNRPREQSEHKGTMSTFEECNLIGDPNPRVSPENYKVCEEAVQRFTAKLSPYKTWRCDAEHQPLDMKQSNCHVQLEAVIANATQAVSGESAMSLETMDDMQTCQKTEDVIETRENVCESSGACVAQSQRSAADYARASNKGKICQVYDINRVFLEKVKLFADHIKAVKAQYLHMRQALVEDQNNFLLLLSSLGVAALRLSVFYDAFKSLADDYKQQRDLSENLKSELRAARKSIEENDAIHKLELNMVVNGLIRRGVCNDWDGRKLDCSAGGRREVRRCDDESSL